MELGPRRRVRRVSTAVDAVRAAVDALVAVGVSAGETEATVLAEAGALAASATERARGAAAEWAAAFDGRASGFEAAALAGAPSPSGRHQCSPAWSSRNDAAGGQLRAGVDRTGLRRVLAGRAEPDCYGPGLADRRRPTRGGAPRRSPRSCNSFRCHAGGSCTIASGRCRSACHRDRAAARGASGEDARGVAGRA